MKIGFLITVISLIASGTLCAQSPFSLAKTDKVLEIKGDKTTFEFVKKGTMVAVNKKDERKKIESLRASSAHSSYPEISYYKLKDSTGILKSFKAVFNNNRLKQLLSERIIFIQYHLDGTNGKLIDASYLVKANTSITPKELEMLTDLLKKYVSFNLEPAQVAGRPVVELAQNVFFEKILNNVY